jgi:hypothetical protein
VRLLVYVLRCLIVAGQVHGAVAVVTVLHFTSSLFVHHRLLINN